MIAPKERPDESGRWLFRGKAIVFHYGSSDPYTATTVHIDTLRPFDVIVNGYIFDVKEPRPEGSRDVTYGDDIEWQGQWFRQAATALEALE